MQQKPLTQVVAIVGTGGPIVLLRGHRRAVNQIGAADYAAEGALIVKAMRFAGLCGDRFEEFCSASPSKKVFRSSEIVCPALKSTVLGIFPTNVR